MLGELEVINILLSASALEYITIELGEKHKFKNETTEWERVQGMICLKMPNSTFRLAHRI